MPVENILDVGTGKSAWPHLLTTCGYRVVAMDQVKDYWGSYFNRHYKITVDDITDPAIDHEFDVITCLSVLEHIPNHVAAIAGMKSLLTPGGSIVLSFPYNERRYNPNIYEEASSTYGQDASFVTQVFSREEVNCWCRECDLYVKDQKYFKGFTGEMWTFGERVMPVEEASQDTLHQLTCLVLNAR
ncbi:class I SAM-dependent methyltransferase [Adhaeretor mobilis]|nr:class I SAM-dependent methyltransferase [Adhaeretor mobilis]